VVLVLLVLVLAACGGGPTASDATDRSSASIDTTGPRPVATSPDASTLDGTTEQAEDFELRWSLLLPPGALGEGYRLSTAPDRQPYLGPPSIGGESPDQYHIIDFGPDCRPSAWTVIVPTQWAFEFVDTPEGRLVAEELFLYRSAADAQAMIDSARSTFAHELTEPSCHRQNLIAPSPGALPSTWTLRFPIAATEDRCDVGEDCHASVSELDPCVSGRCTPVTQVYFRVGRVNVSVVDNAPIGTAPIPIAELLPSARRAAALVRRS